MTQVKACHIGPMITDSARLGLAYAERLLKDIPADKFARLATVGGQAIESNHPAFIFGHLSLYPCRIVADLGGDTGQIEPSEEFQQLFAPSAHCVDDPDGTVYPPMEQVTERFFTSHRLAMETLQSADDSQFMGINPNEQMRGKFATAGAMHAFYVGGHLMLHLGQLSAWRRVWGLPPA